MKKAIYSLSIAVAASSFVLTSCSREFTETQFFQEEIATPITTVEQLESFVRGSYAKMRSANYLGSLYRGYAQIHTDETYCTLRSGRNVQWATYTFTSLSGDPENTWYSIYQTVGNANIAINTSDNLTLGGQSGTAAIASKIKNLKGQAYAVRALAFFDLLRLYGQEYSGGTVGVVLPTVYNPNAKMGRATVVETRAQIESDFANALANIGTSASTGSTSINVNAVKALMSRYYLYTGDYTKAAAYAEEVISSGTYSVVPSGDFATSFTKSGGVNSIFELALGLNGALGTTSYDYLMNPGGYANIAVLPSLVSSYADADVRKSIIVQDQADSRYYLAGKFSDLTGATNIKLIRYEEVLLNAAEAYLSTNPTKSLEYYNQIVTNRGLSAVSTVTLDMIKEERKKELAGEGFRYWDLLRWGETIPYYTSAGVRDSSKDKKIGDKLLTFPIPQSETNVSGSLVVSNPGYDN